MLIILVGRVRPVTTMGGSDCITYFSKNKLRKKENPCNRCSATVTGVHLFYQHMTILRGRAAVAQLVER